MRIRTTLLSTQARTHKSTFHYKHKCLGVLIAHLARLFCVSHKHGVDIIADSRYNRRTQTEAQMRERFFNVTGSLCHGRFLSSVFVWLCFIQFEGYAKYAYMRAKVLI